MDRKVKMLNNSLLHQIMIIIASVADRSLTYVDMRIANVCLTIFNVGKYFVDGFALC